MKTPLILSVGLATCLAVAVPAFAQSATGTVNSAGSAVFATAEDVFSEIERRTILRFFGKDIEPAPAAQEKGKKSKGNGQPGFAKHGRLPPGLAKKQKLPPGLAKKNLPDDLSKQLPPPRPGTERAIVDKAVVLIEQATGKVLDVIAEAMD
jgi:Ni/Co efflux regulator RcnB